MKHFEETAKRATDTIFQERYGVFEQAYHDKLLRFLEETAFLAEKYEPFVPNMEYLLIDIGCSVLNTLIHLGVRSMIVLLEKKQDELIGDTAEARYDDFVTRYASGHFDDIFPEGSEARWLIENRLSLTLTALSELFARLERDREDIHSHLGIEIGAVRRISMSLGDTHGNGRSVYVLTCGGGEKLVYKPHSLHNDILMNRTYDWFCRQERLKTDMKHVAVIDRGDYGWQCFVEGRPCADREQAKRYMYRLGVLLFISNALMFTDLHYENLIAQGEYPIIIDTETLSTNMSLLSGYVQETVSDWNNMIRDSVFGTLLLPTNLLDEETRSEYLERSGLLGGMNVQKTEALRLVNLGRDDIGFDDSEHEIDMGSDTGNRAVLDGKPLHPADFIDQIVSGYRDAFDIVLENKEAFLAFVSDSEFTQGTYRQIMHKTDLYTRFLMASYHPFYLERREMRRMVFSKIQGTDGFLNEAHERLIDREIEQLLHDDVPLFYTYWDSHDLFPPYGEPIRGFFSQTLKEQLTQKINALTSQYRDRQVSFIQYSLRKDTGAFQTNIRYYVPENAVSGETVSEQIRSLVRYLYDLRETQRVVDKNGKTSCYYGIYGLPHDTMLVQENPTMYYGGGAAVLYLQMYTHLGEAYKASAEQALDVCLPRSLGQNEEDSLWGLFLGIGSALYIALQAYRVLGDSKYLKTMESVCQWMMSRKESALDDTDLVNGYTGIIIFCLHAWEKDPSLQSLLDLAKWLGYRTYELYRTNRMTHQSGFAHGYAGPMVVMFMLSRITGNEAYYQAAVDMLHRENDMYLPEVKGWADSRPEIKPMDMWCHGSAGILISRVLSLPYARETERSILQNDIDICLSRLLEITEVTLPALLCHGSAGNLDILLWYGRRMKDERILRFVDERTKSLLQYIRLNGIPTEPHQFGVSISFMVGLSGLAYYLLRYLDPDIPSVLALDTL